MDKALAVRVHSIAAVMLTGDDHPVNLAVVASVLAIQCHRSIQTSSSFMNELDQARKFPQYATTTSNHMTVIQST